MQSFYSLEGLSPRDQALFNIYSRGPSEGVGFGLIHHAFEAVVRHHADATAVRAANGTTMTYGELDGRANALAHGLVADHGLARGSRVVCVFSRSIDMCVMIMAVLKAGGQYVPVDGAVVTKDALGHIIYDSGTPLVLCQPRFVEKVQASMPAECARSVSTVAWDHVSDQTTRRNGPEVDMHTRDGAYVIYTSGTTGKPKGVDVRHEGVCNTLLLEPGRLAITVGSNVASILNVSFDMGAWEVLGTLMNGGTLHLRGSNQGGGDAKVWADCLSRVDTVISTPSAAQKYFPHPAEFPNIKTLICGGEPCPRTLADEWASHARFFNCCGPTEITIMNTCHLHKAGGPLTIGRPNPNNNVYVLDDDEKPVAMGEVGVMWAGGPGVSRGYVNLADKTRERYKMDKFTRDGRMMFNTGDLGRWCADGSLEHLGRQDDQVKLAGFRVELDGVSSAIETFPSVTKACALKIEETLWGFYASPTPVDEAALASSVASALAYYARPKVWRHLATLPLTANGKIDKRALQQLAAQGPHVPPKPRASTTVPDFSEKLHPEFVRAIQRLTAVGPHVPELKSPTKASVDMDSIDDDDDVSSIKKGEVHVHHVSDTLDPDFVLPPKSGFHGQRWVRHVGLDAYRKLFALIFLANVAVFVSMLWRARHDNYSIPLNDVAVAVASNLLASVLFRQDHVINLIFWLAVRVPTSWPLAIRRHLGRVYHIGGMHSGCGVSATMWWLIFTVAATVDFFRPRPPHSDHGVDLATLVLTFLVLGLLMAILALAYPSVRAKSHDQFEWTHRFAGWTALALVWAHVVVSTAALVPGPLGPALAKNPTVYMTAAITLSIALPWMRLRKVACRAEVLSKHAMRLWFDFCTPPPGRGLRITDRPLVDWHAFATITVPGVKGFSVVISNAGDFTGSIIEKPPTAVWTRGVPASGVLTIAPLFRKIVLVATGSGIGPCLPVIFENRVPCRILWVAGKPVETFGRPIVDAILDADPQAVIWDSKVRGRPELAVLAYQLYVESGAECVCIISNSKGTAKCVYELETRRVPAFGPIWDS